MTMSPNSATVCTRPSRPQRHRLRTLVEAAAGNLDVLALERARHVGDGEVVGAQTVAVEPDVDLALAAAEDQHLPDAVHALDLTPQHLVGVLGDVTNRLVRGQGEAEYRRCVRIHPVDTGLLDRLRQPRQDAVHLVAHFLRRDVGVFLEREKDDDLRDALGRDRAEIVDPADGVDRFLDLVGDFRFNLLRRGAGLDGRDRDRRKSILGNGRRRDCVNEKMPMTVSDRMRTLAKPDA
jgi:hypothetical protein